MRKLAYDLILAHSLKSRMLSLCAYGPRNTTVALRNVEQWITMELGQMGYSIILQLVPTPNGDGTYNTRFNIIARKGSTKSGKKRVLFTAHYDTVAGTVGADDNGSGVVSLLQLASLFSESASGIPVEFVFFVNEEPPHFFSKSMGSYHYFAKWHKDEYAQAFNFDCVGYFTDPELDSADDYLPEDRIPGDTIGYIVGDADHASRELFELWERPTKALPVSTPDDSIGRLSDQRWIFGNFPVVQVTDMALYRNFNMHHSSDTPETLDYEKMADVVAGVFDIVTKKWGTPA